MGMLVIGLVVTALVFFVWLMSLAKWYPTHSIEGAFDFATKSHAHGGDRLVSVFNVSFSKG